MWDVGQGETNDREPGKMPAGGYRGEIGDSFIGESHPHGQGSRQKPEAHRPYHPYPDLRFELPILFRLLIVWPLHGGPPSLFVSVAGRFPSAASRK